MIQFLNHHLQTTMKLWLTIRNNSQMNENQKQKQKQNHNSDRLLFHICVTSIPYWNKHKWIKKNQTKNPNQNTAANSSTEILYWVPRQFVYNQESRFQILLQLFHSGPSDIKVNWLLLAAMYLLKITIQQLNKTRNWTVSRHIKYVTETNSYTLTGIPSKIKLLVITFSTY